MAVVTGDRYLDLLARFIEQQAGSLLDGGLVLKLNPVGLHYVQTRLEALQELEQLRSGAPVDYLRAYVADLGDHRALEQLRRVLRLLGSLQVVAVLPPPARDPTPVTLLPFTRLRSLELRGCDLSTSAAKGLLELRPILEKLVCHNSAIALRHIFAERTVEIQDAQPWTRLAAAACVCNGLVLMDESLQLLPAVEALDLSRNNLAKVANLQKCSRLKFLDLGFNHITSVESLNQRALGIITKLVLRNNALASTRGIEKLHALEALDLSHNIISNFHEVETLGCLPSLQSLWLNGNPISVSSYYREEVFSFFHDPSKLELDGKTMTKLERWIMGTIMSRRVKRRAGYGVYVPAKSSHVPPYDSGQPSEAPGIQQRPALRKKNTRLASIGDTGCEELAGAVENIQQDAQTPTAGNEPLLSRVPEVTEKVDPEVARLIQQIESMRREGSNTWLNDLVGFWESDGRGTSGDDKSKDNTNGSKDQKQKSKHWRWMRRRRRGKEEARRRLEEVAVPEGLREAVHVLETVTRSGTEDDRLVDNDEESVGSWQARESTDGPPASPPHYDSALLDRRQNLVNEVLRRPLVTLSATSSDSDSDSLSDSKSVLISDSSGSGHESPSRLVDKEMDFQDAPIETVDDGDLAKDRVPVSESESPGPSPLDQMSASQPAQVGEEPKNWAASGEQDKATEMSHTPTQSPAKTDDIMANAGGGTPRRKQKQKQTRRIVLLEPENTGLASLRNPLLGATSYQPEIAPQLAAPPLSLASRLASSRSESLSRRSDSSLATTVKIAGDLGRV